VRVAGPPIQEGSTGQRVRQLQRGLRALGYEPGTIDGAYGPATRQAIIEFQEDNQIEADGIAGRATLRAVNARLQELRDQAAAGTG
jgi:lysozyme